MIFKVTEFEWDAGNSDKNWKKHQVSQRECESVFFNQPLLIQDDVRHSQHERRFYALGKTHSQRKLFIAFTLRHGKLRVISARAMSHKEKAVYEKDTDFEE